MTAVDIKSILKSLAHQWHNEHFGWQAEVVKEHVKILSDLLNIVAHFCDKHNNCSLHR